MEHLPIPQDPINPCPSIRLRTKQWAEPGPFLEYPDKYGHLLSARYPGVPTQGEAMEGRTSAVTSFDILDYFQGWLFFSLLSECLGDRYSFRNYVRVTKDEAGNITSLDLCTETLHEDLEYWRTNGALATMEKDDSYNKHLDKCLDMAETSFRVIENMFPGILQLFATDMICLASVCEALDASICTQLYGRDEEEDGKPGTVFSFMARRRWAEPVAALIPLNRADMKDMLLEVGWCPGNISRVKDEFYTINARYYFGNFKPDPTRANKHKDCQPHGCSLATPVEPVHVSPDCTCGKNLVEFNEEDLIKVYENGELPCFSIGKLEDGSLAVVFSSLKIDKESQKDPKNHYVALSHVWADGMGNQEVNGLHLCQLGRAQYWARMAYDAMALEDGDRSGNTESEGGMTIHRGTKSKHVNIWIDTMCCPATPGYGKNLCLSMMRDIYSNAHAVLVMSRTLQAMSLQKAMDDPVQAYVVDVVATVFLSSWMCRMWTLQEGVLAGIHHPNVTTDSRLCFAFRDGLLSMQSFIKLLLRKPSPREAALAFDFIGKFGHLNLSQWRTNKSAIEKKFGDDVVPFFTLKFLVQAIKYRNLSNPSDESILLGMLLELGLGVNHTHTLVHGDSPEHGMAEWWRVVASHSGGISADVIFSRVPRITAVPGFRWAPRTLVQHSRYGGLFLSGADQDPAQITQWGLRVRFPGARLRLSGLDELYGRYLLAKPTSADEPAIERRRQRRLQNNLLARIPFDGDTWYMLTAVSLDFEEKTTDGELDKGHHEDIRDTIRDSSIALIIRDADRTGPAIFANMQDTKAHIDNEITDPIKAQIIHQVFVSQLHPSACTIMTAAQECLRLLRNAIELEAAERANSSFEEIFADDEMVERLLRRVADKMLKSTTGLMEAVYQEELRHHVSRTDEDIRQSFVRFADKLAQAGGIEGVLYGEEQLWHID